MKKIWIGLVLAFMCAAVWALPTVQQVEEQLRQGHYTQAESMMSEVVAAKPESAKAHYVYAEILARNGNFSKASAEANRAQQIDPALSFTDPQKFRSFQQLLTQEKNPPRRVSAAPAVSMPVAPAERGGIPGWIWGVGIVLIGVIAWRAFAARRVAAAGMNAIGGTYPPGAAATPGAPYGGMPGSGGGAGLMGTGLAVAGGVAGGMLLDEMLHRHSASAAEHVGGLQPGVFDDGQSNVAANELEERPVDFGSGGNDWDAGGSMDAGGGDTSSWD